MPDIQELNTLDKNDAGIPGPPPQPVSPTAAGGAGPAEDTGGYGALKCYFFTPKRGEIWGAFCLLFDGTTGEIMENVFWVTRALAGAAIDVNVQWRALNKLIPQMGVYEKSLGDKLSVLVVESFSFAARVDLWRSDKPSLALSAVSNEIRNGFERATHCFLEFKMAFERMSKQDLTTAGVLPLPGAEGTAETEVSKPETGEKSFTGTLITCLPVIDPVHGKPVSELEPGDMVEVKIQGGVGAGELIHRYLTSTNQDAIFPVESVERKDSDKTYVLLNVNDEVKGLISVTKDLRLRILKVDAAKKTLISINIDNIILLGVLTAAVVIIGLVIKFLLF
jgi:hypothetical protein